MPIGTDCTVRTVHTVQDQADPAWLGFPVYVRLSRFGGGGLPCHLNFLINLRKVNEFQRIQLFPVVKMEAEVERGILVVFLIKHF